MHLLDTVINLSESASSPWWANPKDWVTMVLSIAALLFSVFSFRRNRRLSIQQAVLKMSLDKAKDCNALWTVAYSNAKRVFGAKWTYKQLKNRAKTDNPEYEDAVDKIQDVVSEMTISKEILKKSFELFRSKIFNISYFPKKEEHRYAYLFWKQLNTSLRDYFVYTAFPMALANAELTKVANDKIQEGSKVDSPFACQVHDIFIFVEKALEQKVNKNDVERLKYLVSEIRIRPEGE